MTNPPYSTSQSSPSPTGFARFVDLNLSFSVDALGRRAITKRFDVSCVAKLDQLIWLALETRLPPFAVGPQKVLRLVSTSVNGISETQSRPVTETRASQLSVVFFKSAYEISVILMTMLGVTTLLSTSNPDEIPLILAPHIALALKVFAKHDLGRCAGLGINSEVLNTGKIVGQIYNEFVAELGDEMRKRQLLRRERHAWYLGSKENIEKLSDYLKRLFQQHGRLSVMHLRLFHDTERPSLSASSVEQQREALVALRASRTTFLNTIRHKSALFTSKPEYVWAILPSLEGGYDLHLTLIFNTAALNKVRQDLEVEATQEGHPVRDHADLVGEYWVRVATGGNGGYLAGERHPCLYGDDWVHGDVHETDVPKLEQCLAYLVTRRALLRLKCEPPGSYFGTRQQKARRVRPVARM